MKKEKYYPPEHLKGQFNCPHCDVYAKQSWAYIQAQGYMSLGNASYRSIENSLSKFQEMLNEEWTISRCEHCKNIIIWFGGNILYPKKLMVELPNDDLLDDIKKDYLEAATIFNDSPRASAAILRLALQKACKQLGEKGDNINDDIKNFVKKGLNEEVQKSLDTLRIIGNNAVHPGEINIEEKPELVLKLFKLINFIAEKMLTEPKEIKDIYEELPDNAKEQIIKRDKQK